MLEAAAQSRSVVDAHRAGHAAWVAFVLVLTPITLVAAVGLPVNPWPRDGWYQTQYLLAGHFPGWDDYTPIAAPALLYLGAHEIASRMGLGLAGEFRVASALQNLLLLLDALFLYGTLRLAGVGRLAGPLAAGLLLFVLSIGLPQCFYSENAALFLMSALLLALARLAYGAPLSRGKLWAMAVLCGVLVGLLVLTRMTPIVLIPAIALLLFRRLPARRVAELTGTVALITALLLAGTILGNRARFGRYELTNSSGRHLWQGVKDFSDRALAHSSEYQALRRIDPHIQGEYWDKLPPDVFIPEYAPIQEYADPREPVLKRLALEAIRSAPGLYLEHGAIKFATSIGYAPSPDGFAGPGWWNPLRRQKSLPPLLDLMQAPRSWGAAIEAADGAIYAVLGWLYPILVFVAASSCLAALTERLSTWMRRRARHVPLAIFIALGAALTLIPVATAGLRRGALAALVCVALLAAGATALHRALAQSTLAPNPPRPDSPPRAVLSFLGFSALMFFGSLWLTWQIEVQATRYAIPYLPYLAIMLGLAAAYWKRLGSAARNRGRAEVARPAPA